MTDSDREQKKTEIPVPGDRPLDDAFKDVPEQARRCPRCNSDSLVYEPKTGVIRCRNCGFTENVPVID